MSVIVNGIIDELGKMGFAIKSDSLNEIRSKSGVHVYRLTIDGKTYIVKYFTENDYKREIGNYSLLRSLGIPTINLLCNTDSCMLMEDINNNPTYRLAIKDDLLDEDIIKAVARWYRKLHDSGSNNDLIQGLYDESIQITKASIRTLIDRIDGSVDGVFNLFLDNYDEIFTKISNLPKTLNYNDFYYDNLIVAKDKLSAIVFDYNLLGKGYRYSDIRNVCSSLSQKMQKVFLNEYGEFDTDEIIIDDVVSIIFTLITAYELEKFPSWAEFSLNQVLSGQLLINLRKLLEL